MPRQPMQRRMLLHLVKPLLLALRKVVLKPAWLTVPQPKRVRKAPGLLKVRRQHCLRRRGMLLPRPRLRVALHRMQRSRVDLRIGGRKSLRCCRPSAAGSALSRTRIASESPPSAPIKKAPVWELFYDDCSGWCLGSESNRHSLRNRILSPARLPISPPRPGACRPEAGNASRIIADLTPPGNRVREAAAKATRIRAPVGPRFRPRERCIDAAFARPVCAITACAGRR